MSPIVATAKCNVFWAQLWCSYDIANMCTWLQFTHLCDNYIQKQSVIHNGNGYFDLQPYNIHFIFSWLATNARHNIEA